MCTRQESTGPRWRQFRPSQVGDLRMSLLVCYLLVLFLCSNSKEMPLANSSPVSWDLYWMKKGQNMIENSKRHSDGTFTSDFTRYLDKMKAKDFVEWLTSIKHEGCHEDLQS